MGSGLVDSAICIVTEITLLMIRACNPGQCRLILVRVCTGDPGQCVLNVKVKSWSA